MLTDRQRRMLRFLSDPAVCPEGLTIQRADQDAIREALAEIERVSVEYTRQNVACVQNNHEIEQILGRALGYPKFVDDQKNFPGATDADGVCVGEHVTVTLAEEAAERIGKLQDEISRLNE